MVFGTRVLKCWVLGPSGKRTCYVFWNFATQEAQLLIQPRALQLHTRATPAGHLRGFGQQDAARRGHVSSWLWVLGVYPSWMQYLDLKVCKGKGLLNLFKRFCPILVDTLWVQVETRTLQHVNGMYGNTATVRLVSLTWW